MRRRAQSAVRWVITSAIVVAALAAGAFAVFYFMQPVVAVTEAADPEEVMGVLREYHAAMGKLIMEHQGTVERFAGDAIIFEGHLRSTSRRLER